MKKNYIKMNNNDKYLSFGNIVRIIKKVSNNKNAMQFEIFASIFDVNNVNNTTINNYCIGIRAIGLEYKKIFLDKYRDDKRLFLTNVLSIISILDDKIYFIDDNSYNEINHNQKLSEVIKELLLIASNDEHISAEFINNIKLMDNYDAFIELLNYAINNNKQPIFTQDINIKINIKELDEYLKIKLYYGVNYISSLIELSRKNNMYACADLGSMWFDGSINGKSDYNESYKYYMKAANKNHPKACWMIANLILTKRVNYDFDTMWKYLNKSIELGSAAGYNTMGLCYKNGNNIDNIVDLEKAKYYFNLACDYGYSFAFNNLGKIYEEENNSEEAFKNYSISADLGDSWAQNKVGEYYRKNGNIELAYMYYCKSISSPIKERCAYAYKNLAEYFYKSGCEELKILKDTNKYKEYIEIYNKLKDTNK